MSKIRFGGKHGEVRTGTQVDLDFIGYQCDLREGKVRPTLGHWLTLNLKIQEFLTKPYHQVSQLMSLVHRPVNSYREASSPRSAPHEVNPVAPEKSLEDPRITKKVILIPRSLHTHLKLWLQETNVLQDQPLHPLSHALQIFTDASREGWGAHLGDLIASGTWSLPQSKLHIKYLALKQSSWS